MSSVATKDSVSLHKWEESNNSTETKKVYVVTRFFSRMSTPGRICHDKEAPVLTNETGRKHKFYRDKVMYVATLKKEEVLVTTYKQGRDM